MLESLVQEGGEDCLKGLIREQWINGNGTNFVDEELELESLQVEEDMIYFC